MASLGSIRCCLAGGLLLLGFTGSVTADEITSGSAVPEKPTTDDRVSITIEGYFSAGGCERTITTTAAVSGDRISVRVHVDVQGGCMLTVIVPFTTSVEVGRLLEGHYTVDAVLEIDPGGKPTETPYPGLFSFGVGPGWGETGVDEVVVSPPEPGPADSISIDVKGIVVECVAEVVGTKVSVTDGRVRLVVNLNIPPLLCPGRPIPIEAAASLDSLSPGDYRIDVEFWNVWDDNPYLYDSFPDRGQFTVSSVPPPEFLRGDGNGDGKVGLLDVILLLLYRFASPQPDVDCVKALDADDSGGVTLGDAIWLLRFAFARSDPPTPPFPGCGTDTTSDALPCLRTSPFCLPGG